MVRALEAGVVGGYPDEGLISGRRVFADATGHPGTPDGSCVDAQGFLWNAEYGGSRVVRYAPDGCIASVIEMPVSMPTCCAFGGPQLETLYVSTARFVATAGRPLTPEELAAQPLAGGLFAIDVGVGGIAEPYFRG